MKKYIFTLLIPFFINCNTAIKNNSSSFLEVYYLRHGMNTPFSYPCSMLSKEVLKDDLNYAKIENEEDVKHFFELYKKYEFTTNSSSINARIKVIIHNNNKKIDTLCLGEHFNTFINDKKVKDNAEMLDFLKRIIKFNETLPPLVKKNIERYKTKK